MSSEEMRVELEAFVNTGLREGWCGWPLKEGICTRSISSLSLRVEPIRAWCRRGNRLAALRGRLGAVRVVHRYCVEN